MKLTIGEKIALLRKEKNITQTELAEYLFLAPQAISRWEVGNGAPEITLLPRIQCQSDKPLITPAPSQNQQSPPVFKTGRGSLFRHRPAERQKKGIPAHRRRGKRGFFSETADICGKSTCNSFRHRLK
ncbi:MAG: helix-turn-helix domain-containing protein [Oscillospiraceae bacterium]|nr:helix-turn-helix domain-containing protein [Oscillospiraceae bacterium]